MTYLLILEEDTVLPSRAWADNVARCEHNALFGVDDEARAFTGTGRCVPQNCTWHTLLSTLSTTVCHFEDSSVVVLRESNVEDIATGF